MNDWGPLCALGSAMTWALGSSGYSRMARDHSPFAVNFSRALVALPLFLVAVLFSEGGWGGAIAAFTQITHVQLAWFAVAIVASYGVGDVLFLWSTRDLGVPGALAVASSFPILTALFGFIFHGQRLAPLQIVGLFTTVAGVVFVILAASKPLTDNSAGLRDPRKGVMLALVTACLWALNSYAVALGGQGVSVTAGNSVRMVMAMLFSFAFGRALAPRMAPVMPPRELVRWSWLFALEAFVGSSLFFYGLSHSSLAVGSALASLAPVLSVPVAWLMRTEKFSPQKTFGVCMVVTGIWMLLALS